MSQKQKKITSHSSVRQSLVTCYQSVLLKPRPLSNCAPHTQKRRQDTTRLWKSKVKRQPIHTFKEVDTRSFVLFQFGIGDSIRHRNFSATCDIKIGDHKLRINTLERAPT